MDQTYEDLMLPVLQVLSDGKQYKNKDIQQKVANAIGLTEENKREKLPSGVQPTYKSRTNWAITYLKNAGFISKISRGVFEISDIGKKVLKKPPNKINTEYLMKYPQFEAWIGGDSENNTNLQCDESVINNEETPEDQISRAIDIINKNLADDLLSEILINSPSFFENLVIKLLVQMGYGDIDSAQVVGKSGDEGIDGIINSDKLGFEKIYIQAKKFSPDHTVGNVEIRNFSGALIQKGANKGVFITTSSFSKMAVEAVNSNTQQKIILIDGKRLTNLMIEYNVGVSEVNSYSIKRLDTDFFEEN